MKTDRLLERLQQMRDFCEGATGDPRPHPNNVARLCRDVIAAIPSADGLREALESIANGNAALEDGSDFSRGWNAARFRMREIANRALASKGGE